MLRFLLASCFFGSEGKRRIVDDRCRCEALFQSGGIDKWLEARSGLAPGLRDVVELVSVKVEPADYCKDCAIARIHCDQRGFDLRELYNLPRSLIGFTYAN